MQGNAVHSGAFVVAREKPRCELHSSPVQSSLVAVILQRESDTVAKVILGLSKTLASTLDLDEVLLRILDSIGLVLPLDSCSLLLLDGKDLEIKAARGFEDKDDILGMLLDLDGHPLNRFVIETGTPMLIDDVSKDPRWSPHRDFSPIKSWMGIPLCASGEVIGMLAIDSREAGVYGDEERELAGAFADFAAVAVRNARLFATTRRRIDELDTVNRVGAAVSSRLEVDRLCEVVGENLGEIFSSGSVYVALLEEQSGTIRLPFYSHDGAREVYVGFPFGEGLTSQVIKSRAPLNVGSGLADAARALGGRALPGRVPLSWLGVPILSGNRALGVLCVQSCDRENAFSDEDLRLLSTIASTVGAGIRNARLYEEARRNAEEAAALADAGREISESLDPDVVLRRIAMRANALLSKDSAAVFLLEGDLSLRAVVAVGRQAAELQGFRLAPGSGIVGRAVATGEGLIVNDAMGDPEAVDVPGTPEEPGEKLIAAPLSLGGKVSGVMAVWRGVGEEPFVRDDLGFLSALARQAAVALENARLHRRVEDEASRSAALYEAASAARIAAEEANRTKSRFLANMTHELRTPLNSIINLAYLVQDGEEPPPPGIRDSASRIEASGRHLLGLINDILDLSKIEAGRMDVSPEESDFRAVARGVLSAAAGLERAPGVELRDEIPESLPPVLADRTRLRQVLFNLLANAVKFTEAGHIAIRARAQERELVVEVEDTGIGMDEAQLPAAFAEFVQLDDDMDRRAGGSGLGLPLSRHLVELQGGKLWAESRKGVGSVFRFTLPRADLPGRELRGQKDAQR
jgi:signal transduction histidine kinase/putative methionine-R-sulfoxide reductase with GAF domain